MAGLYKQYVYTDLACGPQPSGDTLDNASQVFKHNHSITTPCAVRPYCIRTKRIKSAQLTLTRRQLPQIESTYHHMLLFHLGLKATLFINIWEGNYYVERIDSIVIKGTLSAREHTIHASFIKRVYLDT